MSKSEYDQWAPRSQLNFARDKMRAHNLSQHEAEKIASDSFKRLLPDGFNSQDSFLFSIRDDAQSAVGFLWFCVRGPHDDRRAFVCDILIEEPHRGKGYGKQTMLLLEQEVKKLGLHRVGLHAFAFNTVAVNLYQSLGYLMTDLTMEKSLNT